MKSGSLLSKSGRRIRTPPTGRKVVSLGTAALLLLTGCQSGDEQETGSISREAVTEVRVPLDPALVAALDEGNTAYREEDYEEALRHYETAAEVDDGVAAVWFGIYMANLALGNAEAADAAMERARALAR